MATLTPSPKMQFFDANGNPLVGGKLYTYAAGTTTPLATFTDSTGGTSNANPIILDARGEASVWLGTSLYYMELKTSADALIWSADNVGGTITSALMTSTFAASNGATLVGFLPNGSGAVATTVAAQLNKSVQVVNTIATLRLTPVSTTRDMETQGYYASGDGAGAIYTGVTGAAVGTYVDNGGSIIVPTGGNGSEAWLLKQDGRGLRVALFGAKGDGVVTDDTTAINNTLAATSNGGAVYFDANKVYLHSGLIIDKLNISLIGVNCGNIANGNSFASVLKYSGTTGDAVTFTNASFAVRSINIDGLAFTGATTGSMVAVTNCAKLSMSRFRIINDTTGAGFGLKLVDVFQFDWKTGYIGKSLGIRSTGSVAFSTTRSTYTVFGSYTGENITLSEYQYGAQIGNINAADAAGFLSAIDFVGCDTSGCGFGVVVGGGVNSFNWLGGYVEGCTAEGISVYYDCKNVTINGTMFNNPTASVADVRLGKGAIGDASREYSGVNIEGNFFKSVNVMGVQAFGNTGPRLANISKNVFVAGTGTTKTITNCTNNGAGLIRVTSTGHGYVSNVRVTVAGVVGTTEANGSWVITRIDANNFDLVGSTFVNAYVSGGTALCIQGIQTGGVITNTGTGAQDALDASIDDNTFVGFDNENQVVLGALVKSISNSGVYRGTVRNSTQTGDITLIGSSCKIQRIVSTAAAFAVKMPAVASNIGKEFIIHNDATSTQNVNVQTNAGGALITLTPGQKCLAWNDGVADRTSLLA